MLIVSPTIKFNLIIIQEQPKPPIRRQHIGKTCKVCCDSESLADSAMQEMC